MRTSPPNTTVSHIAVIIPARDEAATIAATLNAVAAAQAALSPTVGCVGVLVADACVDDTAGIARRWMHQQPNRAWTVIECSERCVGAARAIGTAAALRRAADAGIGLGELWIANTDADTLVPSDWLTQQLLLADDGVDAVAGIVELDAAAPVALGRRFRSHYRLGEDGTHTHVHGANIAMRANAYLAAGGWHRRPTAEDHDLWQRLGAVGMCVSSTAVVVQTSHRLDGRAPHGFAGDVRMLMQSEVVA